MVVDVPPVGLVGRRTDLHLGVVLEPDIHPLPHAVFLGFCLIYDLCFLNSLLQFGSGLRLGPSQDVPVDGLACLRVVSGGVPALPAAIFPFSEVALPVGSAFCHVVSPPLQQHNIPQKRKISQGKGAELSKSYQFAAFRKRLFFVSLRRNF